MATRLTAILHGPRRRRWSALALLVAWAVAVALAAIPAHAFVDVGDVLPKDKIQVRLVPMRPFRRVPHADYDGSASSSFDGSASSASGSGSSDGPTVGDDHAKFQNREVVEPTSAPPTSAPSTPTPSTSAPPASTPSTSAPPASAVFESKAVSFSSADADAPAATVGASELTTDAPPGTAASPAVVETPYRSTYCRCQAHECQNEFPGESVANICEPRRADGACPAGFSPCVAASTYKMQVSPTTPNSVADVTFSLLASDVAGALSNLGDQNPLRDSRKWWVAFRLPAGWRFVPWQSTTATVELVPTSGSGQPVRQQLQVFPCKQVTQEINCRATADTDNVGFVHIQDMVSDWQTLVSTAAPAPLTFRLARSVVSGSTTSGSGHVEVYVVYENSARQSSRSRRHLGVRELYVSAGSSASASVVSASGVGIGGNLSVISLAKMDTPSITQASLHSSMLWVEVQRKKLTLSFSTSTIVGRNSNDPKICVNLRPATCTQRGHMPTANVSWTETPTVNFANGGNPFLFFYEIPDTSSMTLLQVNETFFCVSQLIPSGINPNTSWELHQAFKFQLSIEGVVWSSDMSNSTMIDSTGIPTLAEISLINRHDIQGTECSQVVVHEQPSANHGLSVYSVMSVTIYAVAFVGAVLITRMNGITFSASTFYNDMTSVCVVIVFLSSIIGNTIWINVSGNGTSTNASHVYYLTRILTACFAWTMITSVCFHWSTVLNHDVRKIRRVYLMFTFAAINAVFYTFGIFMLISMSDFFKCAYDDYLKNPKYDKRMCDTDYCPDLQPYQWNYAATQLCNAISYSNLFFVATFSMDVLMFLASVALLVLGTYVLQRGSRLIAHTGNLVDERIVMAMRHSLKTYLIVILAVTLSLGISTLTNIVLYAGNLPMNAIAWYTLTIWLPTLVPPAGFLVLQWNPRLHGTSLNQTEGQVVKERRDTKADEMKKALGRRNSTFGRLSDGWAGITDFPDTDYLPIGAETTEGPQQLLTLSTQFVTPVPISNPCYMELYVGEPDDAVADDFAFTGRGRAHGSVNTMLQTGLLRESMIVQSTRDNSTLLHSMLATNASWVRAGVTESVMPTNIQDSNGQSAQVATFMSTVQLPNVSPTSMLRFVIYELPGGRTSSTSSTTSDRIGGSGAVRPRRASSGVSRARVFCEFTCSSCEFVNTPEVRLVASAGSHRGTHVASLMGAPADMISGPVLRVRCTTVSTRTLKESSGFYITKCFQFAEGEDMLVEDMTESIFTNEIPRQFLDLLQKDRSIDLSRAQIELRAFQEKCKRGLATGLYDNLIDQIQGENVQAVAQAWLEERVRQRESYIEALKECQQLCVNRAEEGLNIKASTEKKSLLLRFLPINLHIQDMWVGPTSDLSSQLLRRTSEHVKLYTGVTVGAFAAHGFKFRHGAGIISLRNRISKKAPRRSASDRMLLSRNGSSLSEKSVDEAFDWTEAEARADDELKWHIVMRMDMCVSQALTALVASFCRNLEAALQHPSNHQFLHLINSSGFLWQVESLLSTQGKELGMLEDFYAAVEAMKGVSFVLDTAPAAHLPPTLNLHIKDLDLPSVVSARLSGDSKSGVYTVVIGVRCSKEVLDTLPAGIRAGAKIPVTAVMFTQGINEMQTLANGSNTKKTTLQQTINFDNFLVLKDYVDKYKNLASQAPGTFSTDLKMVENLLTDLEEKIMAASKQMVKTKHPKIIQLSSRLCRLLCAGRVTSCKSAKDRTGMSVTLEQGHILCDYHGLPQEFLARTVSTMRSNGVRLENAFKNTGKRQYAFNALQRSLLPEEYKCPEGTYGRGNVS